MVIDMILVAIVLICAFAGLNKGFLGSLFSLMCFLLSTYLTILCLPVITNCLHFVLKSETNPLFIQDDKLFLSFMQSNVLVVKAIRNILDLNKYITIGTIVIHSICFLLLHYFVKKFVKKMCKKFVLFVKNNFYYGSFERLGGAFFGLLKGFIFSFVVAFVCVSACEIGYVNNVIGFQISTSVLASSFAESGYSAIKSVGVFE